MEINGNAEKNRKKQQQKHNNKLLKDLKTKRRRSVQFDQIINK